MSSCRSWSSAQGRRKAAISAVSGPAALATGAPRFAQGAQRPLVVFVTAYEPFAHFWQARRGMVVHVAHVSSAVHLFRQRSRWRAGVCAGGPSAMLRCVVNES